MTRADGPLERQQTAFKKFQGLPPVEPHELVGLWSGRGTSSGHPFDGVLENLGWFGKRFTPDLRADALLFRSGERRLVAIDAKRIPLRSALRFHQLGRTRIARNLFSYLQRHLRANGPIASVDTVPFGGLASAAMVYDKQPIVDYFRRIDDNHVMGAMVISGEDRLYFFELERVGEPS